MQISATIEKDHGTLKTELGYSANYQEHKKDKDYVFTYGETPVELLTKFKTKIETFVGKVPEVIEVKPIDIIIE